MPLRAYDPAIARWNRIDPVKHHTLSPYNAFDNNPVFYADPSGGNSWSGGVASPDTGWGSSGGSHYGGGDFWSGVNRDRAMSFSGGTSFGTDLDAALGSLGYFKDNNNAQFYVGDLSEPKFDTDPWEAYFGAKIAQYNQILNQIDPLGQAIRGFKDEFLSPFKALGDLISNPSKLFETPDTEQAIMNNLMSIPGAKVGRLGFNFMTSAMSGDFYGMGGAYGAELGEASLELGLNAATFGAGRGLSALGRGIRTLGTNNYINLASKARTNHILAGDATGGGHAWFASRKSFMNGLLGRKSMFPWYWSHSKIMNAVSRVAMGKSPWVNQTALHGRFFTNAGNPAKFYTVGWFRGRHIKVVMQGDDIITGFIYK